MNIDLNKLVDDVDTKVFAISSFVAEDHYEEIKEAELLAIAKRLLQLMIDEGYAQIQTFKCPSMNGTRNTVRVLCMKPKYNVDYNSLDMAIKDKQEINRLSKEFEEMTEKLKAE